MAAGELAEIADRFPLGSPARMTLYLAVRRLKVTYAYSKPQKLALILGLIAIGNGKIGDLVAELGLRRPEIESLVAELIISGHVDDRREKIADNGRGRPYRIIVLTERGKNWAAKNRITTFFDGRK